MELVLKNRTLLKEGLFVFFVPSIVVIFQTCIGILKNFMYSHEKIFIDSIHAE